MGFDAHEETTKILWFLAGVDGTTLVGLPSEPAARDHVAAALRRAYNAGLERAAVVADTEQEPDPQDPAAAGLSSDAICFTIAGVRATKNTIAARIRSLITEGT